MSPRRRGVGYAAIVIGDAIAFAVPAFLALRAGMLFPTNCGAEVAIEECSLIHATAAKPFYMVLWSVLIANFVGLVWVATEQRLTERQ